MSEEEKIIESMKRSGLSKKEIKKILVESRKTSKIFKSKDILSMLLTINHGIPLELKTSSFKVRSTPLFPDKKTFLRFKSKELRKNPSYYEKKFLDLKERFEHKFIFQYPVIIKDDSNKGYIIDFYFPSVRVAVEIDSYTYHYSSFTKDLERDYKLLTYNDILVIRLKLKKDSNIESLIIKVNTLINSKRKQKELKKKLKSSFKLLEGRYLGFNF